ncbi:aspartate dehydrogenase [Mesorhizobium muleiense]|uniref:aspartate dehydrogenase n=1 Tax=Mesorhizobium muleiense TaxID=1004279 RepID=UPI001F280664|nr:aspartate dehydrogenase [Mesorhizobium muleiense]MCF6108446.1 aspartate dehydrogenase [Mesorhizobium muleiense]
MTQAATARDRKMRLCLIGAGAIGQRVAEFVGQRLAQSMELVAIAERPGINVQPWWTGPVLSSPTELAGMRPDIVLEAASRQAVKEWGEAALRCARKFIICSASALTDDGLREALLTTAHTSGSQLVVPHGALGGLHALSAASLLPLDQVTHIISKPPAAWKGTAAETGFDLSNLPITTTLFEGSAREAASSYPANANAVVLSSLAGIGLDRTLVRLVADPAARRNIHEVTALGAFGAFSFRIENEPMPTNAKTSDMAALSLVKLLESEAGTLVV